MSIRILVNGVLISALATAYAACGSNSPSAPSGGNDGPIAQTITITAAGVSPKDVTVAVGSRVTFVNNDSSPHTMASNPHPTHGSCPGIDNVGFVAAGSSKTSSNLEVAKTCGYHDHQQPDNTALQGTIRVQ